MVSISDSHIRDALDMPLKGVKYSLRVGNRILGLSGDVATAFHSDKEVLALKASDYPFSIEFNPPPFLA